MTEHSEAVPAAAGRGAVDIAQKFGRFTEHWSPKIIAESNGWQFKLVKARGEFVGHQHDIDEVFLVFAGQVTIQLQGADDVTLGPGQLFVVPRRTEYRPYAPNGCQLMLLEPAGVVNTGSAPDELTARCVDLSRRRQAAARMGRSAWATRLDATSFDTGFPDKTPHPIGERP